MDIPNESSFAIVLLSEKVNAWKSKVMLGIMEDQMLQY